MSSKVYPVVLALISVVLLSCKQGGEPPAVITDKDYPRYDMLVNGFEGMAVFPYQDIYPFKVEAKGDLDAFSLTSCHRETWKERVWNVQQIVRYGVFGWGKRVIDKKREVEFDYKPTYIEGDGDCMLVLQGFEIAGNNSFFAADFESSKYQLGAYLQCDGITKKVNGTSICQGKVGSYQGISFDEIVTISAKNKCGIVTNGTKNIEINPLPGFCVAIFKGLSTGKKHKLTVYGYTKTYIRK